MSFFKDEMGMPIVSSGSKMPKCKPPKKEQMVVEVDCNECVFKQCEWGIIGQATKSIPNNCPLRKHEVVVRLKREEKC